MGSDDGWSEVLEQVKAEDIAIIEKPIWLGEKSSLFTLVIERLYGSSSVTNDKGQSVFYNKVGGAIVTGNEDSAKHSAASIIYGLSHIGFLIPPNVDAYWVVKRVRGSRISKRGEITSSPNQRLNVWLISHTI